MIVPWEQKVKNWQKQNQSQDNWYEKGKLLKKKYADKSGAISCISKPGSSSGFSLQVQTAAGVYNRRQGSVLSISIRHPFNFLISNHHVLIMPWKNQ